MLLSAPLLGLVAKTDPYSGTLASDPMWPTNAAAQEQMEQHDLALSCPEKMLAGKCRCFPGFPDGSQVSWMLS